MAAINFAIAAGAGGGGVLLELSGARGVFLACSLILLAATLIVVTRVRVY